MSIREYQQCDDFISVRHVRYDVKQKGFRVKRIILATTLLNAVEDTAQELAELYCRRWQVELDIRSLKPQMQMEHLRCQSPAMVRKEVYAHMIAYNLIRDLIVHTSIICHTSPSRLSHKNAVQSLNAFWDKLKPGNEQLEAMETALYDSIMEHTVGDRKPRLHLREIKRRPKNYKLMQKPRHAARRSAA